MQQEQQQEKVSFSTNDMILIQLRDLKESVRDIKGEIKDVRKELNETRRELNTRMDRIEQRIDHLENKIESASNHGQISTITTIGIALAVIYSVLK